MRQNEKAAVEATRDRAKNLVKTLKQRKDGKLRVDNGSIEEAEALVKALNEILK